MPASGKLPAADQHEEDPDADVSESDDSSSESQTSPTNLPSSPNTGAPLDGRQTIIRLVQGREKTSPSFLQTGYHNTGKNPVYDVLYGIIIYYVSIQSVLCPAAAA